MSNESSQALPPNGRLISAGMAGAAAIGLLIHHFSAESHNVARLLILGLGPLALFLGLGGMVEPRIVWSVGKYGKHLPAIYKVMGGSLAALGVAVTMLLIWFVYPVGPAARGSVPSQQPKPRATAAKPMSRPPIPSPRAERRVSPKEVVCLTYARPKQRWEAMNEEALRGVLRDNVAGVVTLQYAEGEHALLKVVWPEVLEVGDRFTVELRGANSVEMVDLEGPDANARISLPAGDRFILLAITREQERITFTCDGQSRTAYHASGNLRGEEARTRLLTTALRPGFSVKKGEKASFRNAQIIKP